MERDGVDPVENTAESSPLMQQPAAGTQSPVPIPVAVSDGAASQETTQGSLKVTLDL